MTELLLVPSRGELERLKGSEAIFPATVLSVKCSLETYECFRAVMVTGLSDPVASSM